MHVCVCADQKLDNFFMIFQNNRASLGRAILHESNWKRHCSCVLRHVHFYPVHVVMWKRLNRVNKLPEAENSGMLCASISVHAGGLAHFKESASMDNVVCSACE